MPTKKQIAARRARINKARAKALQLANRRFRDRNRRFNRLSVGVQRIKIIRDVVSLLRAEKLKALHGHYLWVKGGTKKFNDADQVHKVVEQSECSVCGIGGLFAATVLLNNKSTVRNVFGYSANEENSYMRKYLEQWFDNVQLDLIEAAFEVSNNLIVEVSYFAPELDAAVRFGRKHRASKDRLLAICKNMLANKGKFVPVVETKTV